MQQTAETTVPGAPISRSSLERIYVMLVLGATALVYSGTLHFEFVYDDTPLILSNPFLKSWRFIPQYFVSSLWKHLYPMAPGNYYRPLFLLWARSLYALFQDRPFGWHFVAVAMFVLTTWLVYAVIRKFTGDFTLAWISALIFGLHPMHHEVVSWITGATETLFTIFFLAAFWAYLVSRENSKQLWMAVSALLYGIALLAKEAAIMLPALVFVHVWLAESSREGSNHGDSEGRFPHAFKTCLWYVPPAVIYLAIRIKVLSGFQHAVYPVSKLTWLLTLPSILFFYLRHWLLPTHLSEFSDLRYQSHLTLVGVVLPAVSVAATCVALWFGRKRLGASILTQAAAWVIIPLLPMLNVTAFLPDELVHDRYFFISSIGASLIIALIIRQASTRRLVFGQPLTAVAAALVLTLVLGLGAARASSFWVTDYALFSRGHQIAPNNPAATNNLAGELINRGNYQSARALIEKGIVQNPQSDMLVLNLGRLNYIGHQYPEAEAMVHAAMQMDPESAQSYVLLSQIELKENKPLEASKNLHRAVELNPYSAPYHTSYGIVLALNGDCGAATQEFQAALALNPGEGLTQFEMARCRSSQANSKAPENKPG